MLEETAENKGDISPMLEESLVTVEEVCCVC